MLNEHSSQDEFEEDDTFTLFRHFRHNAIINEEDEEESDVNSEERNEERCKDQGPTRNVELLTMNKAPPALELSTTGNCELKSHCLFKKDTNNSQKKFRQRKLAVYCHNMETENEETSLDGAKQFDSLSINKLSIEGSRPLGNEMFTKNGRKEETCEVSGIYNSHTGKTTVLKCDGAEKTERCSKEIRLPCIEVGTQCVHQNKMKQATSNVLVESTNNKRNEYVYEKQNFKPSQNNFLGMKTQNFALENSDNISFLNSEAMRFQKERKEELQRLKWKIYESNMQKRAAKEGEKTHFRKKQGIPVRRSVHRIPVDANGCQGTMLMQDIGLRRRERAKSYPSRYNRFENSAHFLQFIREENENIGRKKDLSEAEDKHETNPGLLSIDANLTKPGTEIGNKNLVNFENERTNSDRTTSDGILEGKVRQTSLVDQNSEEGRSMCDTVKNSDEEGKTKKVFEVGLLNDAGRPYKHTMSEKLQQDSESKISRMLYRTRSESDQLGDKIKKFFDKPLPQTSLSSLRVITEKTVVAPERGFGKLSESEILPVFKRDKTRGVVNLQTCPSLNVFTDRSWQYQDKMKCRYIRSMSSPIPPVEDMFRD